MIHTSPTAATGLMVDALYKGWGMLFTGGRIEGEISPWQIIRPSDMSDSREWR